MTTPNTPPASSRERKSIRLLIAVTTVAVLSVAILTIAGFATGRDAEDVGTVGKTVKEHTISAPVAGRSEATFEVLSGAESLALRCLDTGTDLYRASTPKDSSLVPQATANGDLIQLSLVASGSTGPASVEIVLSSAVRWTLKMVGGGMTQTIDCGSGYLSGLELGQGVGTVDAALPAPQGTMSVRLIGGAGTLNVHLARGLPVGVKVGTGAGVGVVNIDGQITNDVKPGTEITPREWGTATDRYLVDAASGMGSLTIDRR